MLLLDQFGAMRRSRRVSGVAVAVWFSVCLAVTLTECRVDAQEFADDSSAASERLVHLNIVYRHGDRAPTSLYKSDPNNASFWRRGLGELTKEGCRMHYKLGTFLRGHYSNFITGDPKEIHVQSSNKNRCLDSASCHLAGMYRPSRDQSFIPGLPWQPIPVHTRPLNEDGLLAPGNGNCPNADRAYSDLKSSPEARQFLDKYADFYRNLTAWSGDNITDWDTAGHVYDTVLIERLYGLKVPSWAVEYFEQMEYQQDQSFFWYTKTVQLQRFRAGPIAKEILANMEETTRQPTNVRVHMYSTHDTLIGSLLSLYELFDGKSPKYCSTILVELWQDVFSGNYTVKLLRLDCDDMTPRPVLSLPLAQFASRFAAKLPADWERECGRIPDVPPCIVDQRALTLAAVARDAIALVCIVLGCLCICCRCTGRKKTIMYQPLPTETVS